MKATRSLERTAAMVAAGIMIREVYLTECLKRRLVSSVLGLSFEKVGKRTVTGKVRMVIKEAKFMATRRLPMSMLEVKWARMMVWYWPWKLNSKVETYSGTPYPIISLMLLEKWLLSGFFEAPSRCL